MKKYKRYLLLLIVGPFMLFGCASSDTTDAEVTAEIESEIKEDESGSQAPMDPDTDMTPVDTAASRVSADNPIGREMNIVALVQQNPNLSTLLELIKAADMVVVLESPAPYTVFAPTNRAFAALPAGTLDALKRPENKMELKRILQAHVLPNRITTMEMSDNMPMKTAQGDEVVAKRKGQTLTVGGAQILMPDMKASNGVVHVVDKVLVPPKQ
mgnify:CR=1 FL=1